MTRNIWIDLQMSLAEIEAEISDIPDELLRIPTVGNAMGRRGLKGSDRRCTQPQTACLAVRTLSRRWLRGRFPDASVRLAG